MSQIVYKGKKKKANDVNGDGRLGMVIEFEKWGITMINGNGVMDIK